MKQFLCFSIGISPKGKFRYGHKIVAERFLRGLFYLTMVFLVLGSGRATAQPDFTGVEITTTHVAGNIYMLQGSGGNIGVSVGRDGVLIVDDQFAPLSGKISAALKEIDPGAVKFVLNTHWHGDHTGGNANFSKTATIIAHNNVRKRLSTQQSLKFFNSVSPPAPKEALPVITFNESLSVHFNDEEITVIHFPFGHTDTDSVILFTRSNVVHMGDHFFNGMFPFIDIENGGDVEGVIRNVEGILETLPEDVKLIPGHGELADRNALKNFRQMLVETTALIRQRMETGKSLEEIQEQGLPERWQAWESPIVSQAQWIGIVYDSLSKR